MVAPRPHWACSLVFLLASCGYSDSGSGTDTLEVLAEATFDAGSDTTTAAVTVRRDGASVSDATVTLNDDGDNEWTLQGSGDTYGVMLSGYHRRLRLRIAAGADHLTGQLEGPGSHEIESPNTGAQISPSDLGVRWKVPDGIRSDSVSLQLQSGRFQTTFDDDDGSALLPGDRLIPGTDELVLTRRNEIALTGGVGASYLRLGYSVRQALSIVD